MKINRFRNIFVLLEPSAGTSLAIVIFAIVTKITIVHPEMQ
jgi:hypothetical protein